jgi:hypoxanthine-DNA glycosylase
VLILGSLPGERSLAEARYYAHPQNRFWHLVGGAIDVDLPALAYPARLEALRQHRIGLWDVIASAERQGSLDTAIREPQPNALCDLTASLTALRAVAFNGGTAAKIGTQLLKDSGLAMLPLPSSSPAYAAMPLAQKQQAWMGLRKFLL